ncbi:SDR family NAD(P)-dependent oxidoreductase [Mycobacterium sp. HUMS_1102779]|uniref:SDR family NAD(P)-dependent oxidoreductase n=1 Tax=Mycobacterium sp. HUMS_1102779 TaxID=3383487 RepID=UPI00389A7BF6
MRLEGKVALVTGATGGMGGASARLFAKEGAAVLVAARHQELADPILQEITDAGGKAAYVSLDITEHEQWEAAVQQAKDQFDGLHILMNVVGSNELVMLPDVDLQAWNKVFEINVTATMVGMQTCAPLIRDSGGGSIVNIGSVGGLSGTFSTAYSSSKWALEGLSRSAAYIYADWGIRCNVIQPGFIATKMTAPMQSNPAMKAVVDQQMNETVLLRRMGKPEEIANTALFLASDESSYITGTDIVVDGGWFSAAAYLTNERRNHMLEMMQQAKK